MTGAQSAAAAAARTSPTWLDRLKRLRDIVIGSPAFQRRIAALPLTRPIAEWHTAALFDIVAGFVYAQTLLALVELDMFRRLSGGPRSVTQLADDLDMPERGVEVLMEAGVAVGLIDRRSTGYGLALRGAAMLAQGGVAELVAHHSHFYADIADPLGLMRGDTPTALAAFWPYSAGPRTGVMSSDGYTHLMAASQAFVSAAVIHLRPFRCARQLLDLGGGAGAFAIAALKCHEDLTATVADRADVVPHAEHALSNAGMAGRARATALDIFHDSLPAADLVTLVRICHDHEDADVIRLLRNVARGRGGATLLIIEPMASRRSPTGLDAYFPWYFRAMGQGRLRTPKAIGQLLATAGFERIHTLPSRNKTLVRVVAARVSSD